MENKNIVDIDFRVMWKISMAENFLFNLQDPEETIKVAETSNCPVIISGGVSCIDDIKKAKSLNTNIEGIIVGKAIYDGDIKLDELAKELDA